MFYYFVTSLVVIINGFVWMPGLPSLWYDLEKVMYIPFRPYLDLMFKVLGPVDISYQVYALITRSPFIIIPLGAVFFTLWRTRFRSSNQQASGKQKVPQDSENVVSNDFSHSRR